jgi:hypothetical protein
MRPMEKFIEMLQAAVKGRTLPRGEATGVIEFRAAGVVEPTGYLELATARCRAELGDPPAEPVLSVWSTEQGFEDLAGDFTAGAPLHVDGDRALLKSLGKVLEGSGNLLAIRLAAARSSPPLA